MANIATREVHTNIVGEDILFVQDVLDLSEGVTGKSKQTTVDDIQTYIKREIGHVKINTGNGVNPILNLAANAEQDFDYTLPLGISSFPTTTFPMMVASPSTSDIYDDVNNTFPENLVSGQWHLWRQELSYANKPNNQGSRVILRIYNPLSAFSFPVEINLADTDTSGNFGFTFATIADAASLPSPLGTGVGYRFAAESETTLDLTLDSLVRRSEAHDPNATDRGFTP